MAAMGVMGRPGNPSNFKQRWQSSDEKCCLLCGGKSKVKVQSEQLSTEPDQLRLRFFFHPCYNDQTAAFLATIVSRCFVPNTPRFISC
jgi:hypothetical protein